MQLYNTIVFCNLAKPLIFSWLLPKALYSLIVCTSKKYKKKKSCRRLLFETHIQFNKITLIRINFPTLALDSVITVHITTYKCRQTIAEVQLSYRVNQDTRQTRERKIYCQAKKVKMQTPASSNKQASGCLRGEHLSEWTREPPWDTYFFASTTQPLLSIMIFFLLPHIDFSKFRADGRNMHFHTEANPPISLPQRQFHCWWFGGRWRWWWWVTSIGNQKA